MKITVISDIHGMNDNISKISECIEQSDLILIAGDISKNGERKSAEECICSLEKYSKRIIAVHGNWDSSAVSEMLTDKKIFLHGSGIVIDETGIAGSGGSNFTPMHTPSEYSEDEIYKTLSSGYEKIKSSQFKILLSHTPPYYLLDRTFSGINAGSRSVLKFIDDNRIDFCVCGHIHEAKGITRYNNTIILNAGSFAEGWFGSLDTDTGKIELFKTNTAGTVDLQQTIIR